MVPLLLPMGVTRTTSRMMHASNRSLRKARESAITSTQAASARYRSSIPHS